MDRMLRDALSATPGVREVAVGTQPLRALTLAPAEVEGAGGVRHVSRLLTGSAVVGPDYFAVARIPLVRGRTFDKDPSVASGEIIVSQSLARELWPEGRALGSRIRVAPGAHAPWATVVGITGNVRMPGPAPSFWDTQEYGPASAVRRFRGNFLVRADGDVATLRPLLERAVERAGVGATIDRMAPAVGPIDFFAYRGPRSALELFSSFTLLAVILGTAGLFGIVSYAVARRTREIAVRIALGAEPASLSRMVLGQTVRLVVAGCGIGLVGAYGASHALKALVRDANPIDPIALGGAVLSLLGLRWWPQQFPSGGRSGWTPPRCCERNKARSSISGGTGGHS